MLPTSSVIKSTMVSDDMNLPAQGDEMAYNKVYMKMYEYETMRTTITSFRSNICNVYVAYNSPKKIIARWHNRLILRRLTSSTDNHYKHYIQTNSSVNNVH